MENASRVSLLFVKDSIRTFIAHKLTEYKACFFVAKASAPMLQFLLGTRTQSLGILEAFARLIGIPCMPSFLPFLSSLTPPAICSWISFESKEKLRFGLVFFFNPN